MAKPQRALWELSNLLAAHYGQPLEPEPDGGFAEEDYPRGFFEVVGWFRDAMPERCRRQRVPVTEIARIARLVNEWKEQMRRPRNVEAEREVTTTQVHDLQFAVEKLKLTLRPVLDRLLCNPTPGDPAVTRLVDLWNAARLAGPYIGPPPTQGSHPLWHHGAWGLEDPVRVALKKFGAPFSRKADAPLVRIISAALVVLDGKERKPDTVAAALRRRRRKGDRIT
jgi:hypothetical protein